MLYARSIGFQVCCFIDVMVYVHLRVHNSKHVTRLMARSVFYNICFSIYTFIATRLCVLTVLLPEGSQALSVRLALSMSFSHIL